MSTLDGQGGLMMLVYWLIKIFTSRAKQGPYCPAAVFVAKVFLCFSLVILLFLRWWNFIQIVERQRTFNYQLSRAWFVTENAFGCLKGRWRCLLKKMILYNLKYVVEQMATCCTMLYNALCEIHGDSFDDSWKVANQEDTRASSGANQSSVTSCHDVWEALATNIATWWPSNSKLMLIEN